MGVDVDGLLAWRVIPSRATGSVRRAVGARNGVVQLVRSNEMLDVVLLADDAITGDWVPDVTHSGYDLLGRKGNR